MEDAVSPPPPAAVLSEATTQRCWNVITQKLSAMLGEEGVEILTEYIWHMITRPKTTKEHVASELQEFLGSETENFVDWLINTVGAMINEELQQQQQSSGNTSVTPTQPQQTMEEPPVAPVAVSQTPSSVPEAPRRPPAPPPPAGRPRPQTNLYVDPATGQAMQLVPISSVAAPERSNNKGHDNGGKKIKRRCGRYPSCPFGDSCRYVHPSEMCRNWPMCNFGEDCFYIHPDVPCKYGINCPNPNCNYTHPPGRNREALPNRFNIYTGTFRNVTYRPPTEGGDNSEQQVEEQQQQEPPPAEQYDQ